jgi:predicted transcriptional regulator
MRKNTYKTERLSQYLSEREIGAMDLVRLAGIAVSTAYRIKNSEDLYDLDVFYNIYTALKENGYEITWEQIVDFL